MNKNCFRGEKLGGDAREQHVEEELEIKLRPDGLLIFLNQIYSSRINILCPKRPIFVMN